MSDKIKVKNRNAGPVVYTVPELQIRREFTPGETKSISKEELTQLSYQYGGLKLMQHYLILADKTFAKEIGIKLEPEYWLQRVDIKNLLLSESLDVLLDCLDFAPIGVLNLIKQEAVTLPLKDTDKIKAIKDKLGFDVATAIQIKAENAGVAPVEAPKRRVKQEQEPTERRTAAAYEEVLKEEEVEETEIKNEIPKPKYQRV